MGFRSRLAVLCAKCADCLIRRLKIGNGGSFPGYVAGLVDPGILGRLAGMVREKVIVVTGTNGKTTVTHILCHVLEAGGKKVVSNRTGANMPNGILTAFVLAADRDAYLDADYACIEVDEFAAQEILARLKPHCMVVTNVFRDQLDRFGEVDAVVDRLKGAAEQAPDGLLVLNGDDAVSYSLAYGCRNPVFSYGMGEAFLRNEPWVDVSHEGGQNDGGAVRENAVCRLCGEPLAYDYFQYGQLGSWHCPNCGVGRPEPDCLAGDVVFRKGEFSFVIADFKGSGRKSPQGGKKGLRTEKAAGACHVSGVKFAYNVYNVLSAYSALSAMDAAGNFGEAMRNFDFGNHRESVFVIGGGRVQLHLAKNPMGFQQKLFFLQEDPEPKDVIIQINDTDLDGRDVSWLWDVDFQVLGNVNAKQVVVDGTRRYDMGLRLKYDDISCDFLSDFQGTVRQLAEQGTGNLYVIVNYSGLYRTNRILSRLQGGYRHEADHRTFVSESAQLVR